MLFDITNLFLDGVLRGSLLPSTFPTYENLDDLSTNLPKDLVNQIGEILTENVRLVHKIKKRKSRGKTVSKSIH